MKPAFSRLHMRDTQPRRTWHGLACLQSRLLHSTVTDDSQMRHLSPCSLFAVFN